jgi:hypothetical protein
VAGDDESGRTIARLLLDTGRRTELESWIDGAVVEGRGQGIVGFASAMLAEGNRAEAKYWCQRAAVRWPRSSLQILKGWD